MWATNLLLVALTILPATLALHANDAGVVDWHKPLIGIPRTDSHATAPVFHRVGADNPKGVTKSVLLSATASNVLAALDPATGNLQWRHIFESTDPITMFRGRDDLVFAISGPGGATLRTFDALTGLLIAEKGLHKPETGRLFDPPDLGTALAFPPRKDAAGLQNSDVFVLTNGHFLRRIDGLTGNIKWAWTAEEQQTALVVYSTMVSTPSAVYLVGLKKSGKSYAIHITAINPSTGDVLASTYVISSIQNGLTDFLVLSDSGATDVPARVVWLESGSIRSTPLTPALDGKATSLKGSAYKAIKDVGLNEKGQFVALKSDGSARVMRLDREGQGLKGIFEFQDSATSDQFTESLFAGGTDKLGDPYIGRIFWSHILRQATVHVFAAHLAGGKGMVTGYSFSFETGSHGIIDHVAIDTANPNPNTVIARIVLTTATGAVQLWQQDKVQWTREEALSAISVAEFVDLPEKKAAAAHSEVDGETFGARLARQIFDARDFPMYLINFAKRFATGSYASVTTSAGANSNTNATDQIYRDTFGFRKIVVVATKRGIIFGINSSNGAVVWSRILGLGWAHEVGGHHQPVKMYVLKTVSDGDAPQVVLLTQRVANNGLVDTVAFHVNALTGQDVRGSSALPLLEGTDVVESEIIDAFLWRGDNKTVVMVDTHLQVHLYPDTDETKHAFSEVANKLHFPLRAGNRLLGHQVLPTIERTGKFTAYATWSTNFPPDEQIVAYIPRAPGPVASLGKVLGNRDTLYKYLNPHLVAVQTASRDATPPTCGVYLLDGAKGTILYHAAVPSAGGTCDVLATLTENWLVYVYYDEDATGADAAKGQRVVSVEVYEGTRANEKTRSSDASIYSNKTAEISVYEQSYILPSGVSAIATTSTKFGISVKDLILANHRNQIYSIPRRMVDPRRPKHKPTAEEMEEWLLQYDALIPDDPRRVISHEYQVAKTQKIITSPALLESTSLVFAYGLDLFSTRVAPSGTFDVLSESFNKAQLVLTISALAIAIVVTKPMVARKRLRERWYD